MGRKILTGFVLGGMAAGILAVAAVSGMAGERGDDDRAPAAEKVTPRCLDGQRVGRFHVVDDHTLLVYDDFGNPYKMDIGGACRGMSEFSTFGFEFNGSTDICKAHDAMLLRREPPTGGTYRCIINGVEPLSRADAEALDR